jgi:hypothetical protein
MGKDAICDVTMSSTFGDASNSLGHEGRKFVNDHSKWRISDELVSTQEYEFGDWT